jgi:hypothetical protein
LLPAVFRVKTPIFFVHFQKNITLVLRPSLMADIFVFFWQRRLPNNLGKSLAYLVGRYNPVLKLPKI